jgi:hypothetical protein
VWVLISVVIGFGVSSFTLSRIGWPQPGVLRVDDRDAVGRHEDGGVAAAAAQHQRLSLTFSTSTTFGAFAAGGCALTLPARRARAAFRARLHVS